MVQRSSQGAAAEEGTDAGSHLSLALDSVALKSGGGLADLLLSGHVTLDSGFRWEGGDHAGTDEGKSRDDGETHFDG